MTSIITTIIYNCGGGSSLIKEITYQKTETALTSRTPPKAEAKTMSAGNTEVKDKGMVSKLCNMHNVVTPKLCHFPLDECTSTLQSFLPVDWQKRKAAGLLTQIINKIGSRESGP